MAKPAVYLAGPLGFSEAGRMFHEKALVPLLEDVGFEVIDPWKLTPQTAIEQVTRLPYGEARRAKWQELNLVIGENNAEGIRKAHAVLAVLDGVDIDSGTASEVGFAFALGKVIVGYRGDFRLSADNEGAEVNLQVEYFIRRSGGGIAHDLPKLREIIFPIYKKIDFDLIASSR